MISRPSLSAQDFHTRGWSTRRQTRIVQKVGGLNVFPMASSSLIWKAHSTRIVVEVRPSSRSSPPLPVLHIETSELNPPE